VIFNPEKSKGIQFKIFIRMKNTLLLYVCPVVLMIALLLQACSSGNNSADAYGNFESTEVIVSAESQGELQSLNLNEGDILHKGSRVGSIDSSTVMIKCHQLIAQRSVTHARRLNLDAQIVVQEEQRKNILRELKRLESLLVEKAVPPQQVDDMNGKLQVLDAQTESIKSQYTLISAEIKVLDTQLEEVENLLSKCRIINPLEGTVMEKYAEVGELVTPGKALYQIADLETMELKVYISGAQLSSIAIGDSIIVRIDSGEKEYQYMKGVVSWISSEVEFTPKIIQTKEERVNMVYGAKIRVINDGRIKIGMPGEVIFIKKEK
jgi:HlyD family secretion protein